MLLPRRLKAQIAATLAGALSIIAGTLIDPASAAGVELHGAGSTFVAPLINKWIEEYPATRGSDPVTYDAVGSGEGVRRFIAHASDFAGSDEALTEAEASKLGSPAVMIPVTAGMIVLAYNVPGVNSEIKLPRDVYPDIFAGVIKRWDDPRIKAANPGLNLPSRDIVIVARQDSSGTTAAFTKHLAAINPGWGSKAGKVVDWPKGTMLAPGNEGVAGRIKISEGSIGYVNYRFAQRLGLRMAALQNKTGSLIIPNSKSGALALSGRVPEVKALDDSVLDPSSAGAYPITTYSWIFIYPRYDREKGQAVRDFVQWILSQHAQSYADQMGYLPLSEDIIAVGRSALDGLSY